MSNSKEGIVDISSVSRTMFYFYCKEIGLYNIVHHTQLIVIVVIGLADC